MHELSITQNILDVVLKEAEKNAVKKIIKVNLKIGDFTFIEPECVSYYFELLAKDTPAFKAVLEIEKVPLKFKCKTCSLEFTIDKDSPPHFICPHCKLTDLEMISGKELLIESIDAE